MSHRSTHLYLNNHRYYDSVAMMASCLQLRIQQLDGLVTDIDRYLSDGRLTDEERDEMLQHRQTFLRQRADVQTRLAEYQESVS
jgi:hypothetical protein